MTSLWHAPITLTDINARNKNTFAEFLGIEFIELGDNYLIAKMPITNKVLQPMGIMHGGASCVLAETIGSNAANYVVDFTKQYCVGLDINTNHLRPIKEGFVLCRAEPFHIGRRTQVWNIPIHNEAGQLVSITRLTMAVLSRT